MNERDLLWTLWSENLLLLRIISYNIISADVIWFRARRWGTVRDKGERKTWAYREVSLSKVLAVFRLSLERGDMLSDDGGGLGESGVRGCDDVWLGQRGTTFRKRNLQPSISVFQDFKKKPYTMKATRFFEIPRNSDTQTPHHTPQDMQHLISLIFFPFSLSSFVTPPPFLSLYECISLYDTLFKLSSVHWIFILF
jgi:hypothetical protein